MPSTPYLISFAAVLSSLLFSACKSNLTDENCLDEVEIVDENTPPKKAYDPANEILAINDLDSEPFAISELKGPAFINLWATWCLPCIMEFPSIQEIKEEMEPEGWNFLFVSTEEIEKIKKFQEENDFDFRYYHMSKKFREYGVTHLPYTYIVNAKGDVVMNYEGSKDWSTEASKRELRDLVK